ncbi:MAG: LysM peptidoglycan-binding domain-containing protein [Actinomycetales bacterium]|nr:LysM peptidoglycan-binding domain-containing protein [Actinomycetales bacterium]
MSQHDTGRIKVVTGTGVSLALAAATVATASGAQAAEQHTVRKGETVSHIAARSGISVAAIARANGLTDPGRIYAGQKLVIPSGSSSDKPARAKKKATTSKVTHTVSSGDTVSHLASRYGTSVKAIVEANDLDSRAFIVVGQKLTIPGTSTAEPEQKKAKKAKKTSAATYTVVAGDTVSRIASKHGVSVSSIVKANDLDSRAFIVVGQKLTLPGAAGDSYELPDSEKVPDTFAGRKYPDHVVDSANKNKAALLAAGVPSKATMQAKVVKTAKKLGVSTALAQAVAYQESGFNHASVSPANAIGTMQVIPTSGDWAATLVGHSINLLDPDDNVTAGVAILRQLVKGASDLDTAIAGYYQGASSVKKYGMFSDTRRYVANVRTLMEQFA